MAGGVFWSNLLDTISGKGKRDVTESQIEAATQVALAQAAAEEVKNSPEALAERRKLIIGVTLALVGGAIIITILYFKFFK